MSDLDTQPSLDINNILDILSNPLQNYSQLSLALSDLIKYILFIPDRIPKNLNEFLIPIFKNPPDDEKLGLCAECIVKALESENDSGIKPSNFNFLNVIEYVKSDAYSENTKKALLEIIFTVVNIDHSDSDVQISNIANSDAHNIDIFFKYYNTFDDSSKISCLKCIKKIVSKKVFDRFIIFLPNLVDIALSTHGNKSRTLYDMSIHTFVIMSKYYLQKNKIEINQDNTFAPVNYCDKLCELTSKYLELNYLDVFIDSIRICIHSFFSTIPTVLKRITLASFFKDIEETRVLESAIKLCLSLMPYPSHKLTYIAQAEYPLNFALNSNRNSSYFDDLINQIQEIIPYVCKIYYSNISLSMLCIQALTIFANTDKLGFNLNNRIIYMMHFQLSDYKYVPYILSIISQCVKAQENEEAIFRSKLVDRLSESIEANKTDEKTYIQYQNIIRDINSALKTQYETIDLKDLDLPKFAAMIKNKQISPFDLLALYNQMPNKNLSCFKTIKKMFSKFNGPNKKDFDLVQDESQLVVDLLLSMLADIPIPILCTDPFYGNYDNMLQDEITFVNENRNSTKILHLNSLLTEYNGHRSNPPDTDNLLGRDENKDISALFNLDELISHNNPYLYEVLTQELSEPMIQQFKVNDVEIANPDQFIITILPQIICKNLDDLTNNKNLNERLDLSKVIHSQFQVKIENRDKKINVSKRNDIICKLRLTKSQEIVQEILEVLNDINSKDRKHNIKFLNENFMSNILEQKKYLFLLMGFYSPLSQLMGKYPFLFKFSDRYFLLQLFVKVPYMSKELFLKDYPNHRRSKIQPRAQIKFQLHRNNIFKEGIIILERFAKYKAFLDISFHGEKGFGDGPTREFFHLMSLEFCEKRHRLWRRDYNNTYNDNEDDKSKLSKLYTKNDQGLFPYATANSRYLKALGLLIAKAIQMDQIIDIPFNPAFFDIAAGREVSLYDIDPDYAANLNLYGYNAVAGGAFTACVDGREYDIIKNGKDIMITEENFDIYKRALNDFVCGKCVRKKMENFLSGFAEVLDPIILTMFTGEEMLSILGGQRDLITSQELTKFIVCESGYTSSSVEVHNLVEIVSEFDAENQKSFIQFVTGSPFLPLGGLGALDPPITVARRTVNQNENDDNKELPTVSTCFNRLKLPPYSSKETMKERLLYAINGCKASFDLS